MGHPNSPRTNSILSFIIVGVVIGVDRVTKIFFSRLLETGESIPVIKNVFHYTLVHNTGIAFGLFKDQGLIFIIIPLLTALAIAVYLYWNRESKCFSRLYVCALSLILGGAIGNLVDRVAYGYVIDFFDFRVWPVFNIADSAITIGMASIFFHYVITAKRQSKSEAR